MEAGAPEGPSPRCLVSLRVVEDLDGGPCAALRLHWLHPHVNVIELLPAALPLPPAALAVAHEALDRRVRRYLPTLDALADAQTEYEAARRRLVAEGWPAAELPRLVHPTVLLDACLLYLSGVSAMTGGDGRCWVAAPSPCGGCGRNEWGSTCTPPRYRRDGSLTRDVLDHVMSFCCTCAARRDVEDWLVPEEPGTPPRAAGSPRSVFDAVAA